MEDLVLTIEQCRHLQGLGLDMSDAKLCWRRLILSWDGREPRERSKMWKIENNEHLAIMGFTHFEEIPTYTLQEILEKLPERVKINGKPYNLTISKTIFDYTYSDKKDFDVIFTSDKDSILEMAYDTLYWVIKNGFLKTK